MVSARFNLRVCDVRVCVCVYSACVYYVCVGMCVLMYVHACDAYAAHTRFSGDDDGGSATQVSDSHTQHTHTHTHTKSGI